MLATPEKAGNRQVLVALCRIPAGQAAPWHAHEGHEEFIYILSGSGEFLVEGRDPIAVRPGSLNLVPPDTRHCHRASATEDLLFLWGYAPPGPQLS